MARPSKLNEELIQQMAALCKDGLPIIYCCDNLGITKMSHSNWMKQGEMDFEAEIDSLFCSYFYTIKKAQSEFVHESLLDIRSGRPGWQGVAWALERTRQDFMPRQEIKAGDDGKVQVVLGGKLKEIKKGTLTESGEIK